MSTIKKAVDIAKKKLGSVGKAKDWIVQEVKKLTEGEITLTEDFINGCISEFTQNHSVELHDGRLVYKAVDLVPMAKKIEITCAYDSCDFRNDTKAIIIKLLDLKPFYLKPVLLALPIKYPFIKISKDADDTRLVTCHLNEIPSLRNNKILNSPFLKYLTIQYLKCEEGKVTIKLKLAGTWGGIVNDVGAMVSEKGGSMEPGLSF
ncbi:MAG: hypothetical protein HZB37_10540 [Planctomycetes bacterium]|nr:hypothetical protein [Planctomycetota bacterium]